MFRFIKLRAQLADAQRDAEFWKDAWKFSANAARDADSVARKRRQALNEIVSTVDGITTPNGTLRKVRRIAEQAIDA